MYGTLYRHLLLPIFDGVIKRRKTMAYWRAAEAVQWLGREEVEKRQLEALRQLLAHAEANCPYYSEEWRQLGLSSKQLQSISDFEAWPLISRDTIRQNRLRLRSTTSFGRMAKATGGSSGEPVHFDLNSDSNDRRTAIMYRGYGWANGAPGSKQLFVWGSHLGRVPWWKRWKASLHQAFDRQYVISCFEFRPDLMQRHVAAMNAYRPEVIIAYTNPLYEMALYIERSGMTAWQPKSIIVGAEKLHDFQREVIERVFQAPVFETYGSREFMLIGAECEHHCGLHLSIDNLVVEILDDDGRPTPAGEEGNVVVTDLFNYEMPFVRYVNGDRAIAGFSQCACGRGLPLMQKVVGRQLDILETPDGRKIPGEFFPHLIKEFPGVSRFQVIQSRPEEITLKLVAASGFAVSDRESLKAEIGKVMGPSVQIRLEFVNEIPLTRAGKLRVVVRETPQEELVAGASR